MYVMILVRAELHKVVHIRNLIEGIVIIMVIVSTTAMLVYNFMESKKTEQRSMMLMDKVDDYLDSIASYKLYDPENAVKVKSWGVYFPSDKYYCVLTANMDYMDVRLTENHEMCHAFVDMDSKHFCNLSNQTNWNIEPSLRKRYEG